MIHLNFATERHWYLKTSKNEIRCEPKTKHKSSTFCIRLLMCWNVKNRAGYLGKNLLVSPLSTHIHKHRPYTPEDHPRKLENLMQNFEGFVTFTTNDSYPVWNTVHEHARIRDNPETEALSSLKNPSSKSEQIFLPRLALGKTLPCPVLIPTFDTVEFFQTSRFKFWLLFFHASSLAEIFNPVSPKSSLSIFHENFPPHWTVSLSTPY